jgi:hypothetical protein
VLDLADGSSYVPGEPCSIGPGGSEAAAAGGQGPPARQPSGKSLGSGRVKQQAIFK